MARQQADLDRLLKFMISTARTWCVAASAAAGNNARLLKDAVAMVVGRIEDHARAIPEEVDTIKVHFADDTVPAPAGQCAATRVEFVERTRAGGAPPRWRSGARARPPGVIAQLASGGEARSMTLRLCRTC